MQDWIEFSKHYILHSKQFKRDRFFITASVPISWFLFLLFLYFYYGLFKVSVLIIFLIISILWIIIYPKRFYKVCLKKTKKILQEGNNSALLGEHNIEFFDDYFFIKQPGAESKIEWSMINKIEENEKYIFIYVSSLSAAVIPKFKIKNNNKEKIFEFIRSKK